MFESLAGKRFGAIAADPPWHFKSGVNSRHAMHHYPTMKMADIRAMPVKELAAPDCALFLWTSAPFLDQSISVMKGWGFRYVSIAFTWVKLRKGHKHELFLDADMFVGLGHTTRKSTEICLLGKVGKPNRLKKNVAEVIFAARREHSRKPEAFYLRVPSLYTGPYLDIFGRESRPGWHVWGNQSGKFDSAQDPPVGAPGGDLVDTESGESRPINAGSAL